MATEEAFLARIVAALEPVPGTVAEAATLPLTIDDLADTQKTIWKDIGNADLEAALRRLAALLTAMQRMIERAAL